MNEEIERQLAINLTNNLTKQTRKSKWQLKKKWNEQEDA